METIRSDSPLCRQIVLAFLDFLNSVEMAPGDDPEAVEVARDCLHDAFKVNLSSTDERVKPGYLVNLFKLAEKGEANLSGSAITSALKGKQAQADLSSGELEDFKTINSSSDAESSGASHCLGVISRDELFGRFYAALDKIGFFNNLPGGIEDPEKTAKAKHFFDEALTQMETSKVDTVDMSSLAEVLKEKGNETMRLNKYSDAIELYTCSIAIKENAVYYCNRAAAYTKVGKYVEAIEDCLKSIKIDPNYSKAFSRLGSAYFSLGQFRDALERGYLRALQLDPTNRTIQENIQVTQQKMLEQHRRGEYGQNRRVYQTYESSTQSAGPTNINFPFPMGASAHGFATNLFGNMASTHGDASGSHSAGPMPVNMNFGSFPLSSAVPVDFGSVIGNMASAAQGHQATPEMNTDHPYEPEVNADANVSINFGESPEQVSDVLRTVMGMFSQNVSQGSTPQGPNENETSGRPG